jgi:hypothetical protein
METLFNVLDPGSDRTLGELGVGQDSPKTEPGSVGTSPHRQVVEDSAKRCMSAELSTAL